MENNVKLRSAMGMIDLEEYFERVRTFHGFLAPGTLLGGLMVDWALEEMEGCEILDALVETRKCLPDAVQLLTKCSTGNGWMRILDWGKLAVTLYDKETRRGARAYLDYQKLHAFPLTKAWAMKEKSKKENPLEPLIKEIIDAGRGVLSCRRVEIESVPRTVQEYGNPRICSGCGEPFRVGNEQTCVGCLHPYVK
jgi:formylmethanofuran dehydrogenase subunit E